MKLVSLLAAASTAIVTAACSSAPTDATATTDEASRTSMYACHVDDDCVAIPAGGCCPNGSDVAVNKHHVNQYEAGHDCKNPPRYCPLYVILETRVAECSNSTHKCEMIQPADVACGGNMMNAHQCASGYACDFHGHVPDVPGTCEKTCVDTRACFTYQHWDSTQCTCVDNP
jgi:hypothetical protein